MSYQFAHHSSSIQVTSRCSSFNPYILQKIILNIKGDIFLAQDTRVFIKCRCGHTWMETDPDVQKDIVITSSTIDETKLAIAYKCEKCGKSTTAYLYTR